ncbi:MAG: M20/M25/M40 family metallo-hydrolase [Opitutaceae bacterium]|jgi:acetylornithine deacetylase/succinyl-diaminopimelate desuccinylase-like protein|nr:M20/M25/M40 family metallo-hydrolase [Opitutaceae bacterium]
MLFPSSVIELLCELVARPSVSPEGDAGGTPPGERVVADYVAGLLRALGGEVMVTDVRPGRPNVVARFPARGGRGTRGVRDERDGRSVRDERDTRGARDVCDERDGRDAPVVALAPHLDTVGVAGMTIPPFAPQVRDGRVYGRGACDTKGPMAAALWALARWLRSPGAARSRVTWVFAATMGEEEMSTGAKALCESGFRADFAVALEPTDLRVVRAEKGVLRVWVESAGRACHGATPGRGDNAIYRMLPFLHACRDGLAPMLEAARHPDLGGASLNLGVVRGGGELNIVPDACRAGLDIRTHPGMPNDTVMEHVRAAAGAAGGLRVRMHREGPPFALAADHPWVRRMAAHARGVEVAPWFSDANVFNAHGTPAVAFGPGSIAQAHTGDEFIGVAALEEGARVLEAFIRDVSE